MAGYKTNSNNTSDIVLMKYALSDGAQEWVTIPYGCSTANDVPQAGMVSNLAGGYYIAGYSDCNSSSNDYLTLKYCSFSGTANAGNNQSICQGASGQLSATGGSAYSWSPGTWLTNSSIANPTVNVPSGATPGSYTYTCTFTDAGGCTTTDEVQITVLPKPATPTITAQGPTTFCQGGSVTLSSSSGSGNHWSTSSLNQSIQVTASGTYWVNVTANGCTSSNSNTIVVTVNPLPNVSVTPSGSVSFCDSGTLTANASGGTPNYTYSWTNSASTSSVANVNASNSYAVTVTDANQCSRTSAAVAVTIYSTPATPTIVAQGPTTFCQGDNVTLSSSSATGNQWSNSGPTTQTYQVTTSGSYWVAVTANGCTSGNSNIIAVTVNPLPSVSVTPSGAVSFCDSGTLTANASGGTPSYSYQWSDNTTGTSLPVTSSNSYSVTVTDANQCSNTSASVAVTVTATPAVPPTPTASSYNPPVCSPSAVTLCTSGIGTFAWQMDNGPHSGSSSCLSVSTTGTHNYTATLTDNGCTSAPSTAISITIFPEHVVTVTPDPALFCDGESITLTSSAAASYLWSPGGATGSSVVTDSSGTVQVTAIDGNGCAGTSSIQVTEIPLPQTPEISDSLLPALSCVSSTSGYQWFLDGDTIPNATNQNYTPTVNGTYTVTVTDANGCTSEASLPYPMLNVGIRSNAGVDFSVYPNPNNGQFELVLPNLTGNGHYQIMNGLGQVVKTNTINSERTQINLASLPKGVYLLRLMNGNELLGMERIVLIKN